MFVAVAGNGEDHCRAERDVGGETEEDGIYSAREVMQLLRFSVILLSEVWSLWWSF